MKDFTERNSKLIDLRPHFIFLSERKDTSRVEIIQTRSPENPALVVHLDGKDVSLHSRFDPVREAARWAEQQTLKNEKGFLFVFGLGLGYHVEALLNRFPDVRKIFVFEVNGDVYRAALTARDLSPILMDKRVCLFVGDYDDIRDSFNRFIADFSNISEDAMHTEILIHRPSLDVFPDDSEDLRNILEYLKLATSKRKIFTEEREANKTANSAAFESANGVCELFGAFKGKPLIVAAAGPSLDQSIKLLGNYTSTPEIVAVDSALAPFINAGIHPGFVVSGDPQQKAADLFRGLQLKDEQLIFFPSSNPEVVALFPPRQRRAACSSVAEDEIELDEKYGKGKLCFSGTVLLAAVDFAVKSGAAPIVLIGADFSFLDEQTHATGSRTQGYNPRYGRIREIRGIGNTVVKSSDILYLYLKDLENYYLALDQPGRIVNATARGAAIFHIPYISFENFLDQRSTRIEHSNPCPDSTDIE